MPEIIGQLAQKASEYNQASFLGGMNLLLDDTHLQPNQYRIGFNLRNRYDRLDPVLSSKQDLSIAYGTIQEMVTFGNYEIIFIGGNAYYKLYTSDNWIQIQGFAMDPNAPRYWTCAVPIATTNYLRLAATTTSPSLPSAAGAVSLSNVAGAAQGNLPGLLVQDNINQPQFIFLDVNSVPTVRTTQTFAQWLITFTDATNTVIAASGDQREYVPIGNVMAFVDGVLYIASKDGSLIYRSVSGRPLDFVINVTNKLADNTTTPPFTQYGGGDASTTGYSVGVGPINCLKGMSDNSLFVAASNANFSVRKNMTQNAPLVFGEYTFIRTFLFNANCLSDRAIIDSIGDTRFIDLTGVRSFNAVEQTQNEGRNSVFTSSIQDAFTTRVPGQSVTTTLIQDPLYASAVLYDDYELYAVTTKFGPAIAVYDTINSCWVGFDISQTGGKRIKKLVKIELAVQALYAITEDDKLYRLYVGPGIDSATFRSVGVCSGLLWAGSNVKLANPRMEVKLSKARIILNNIIADSKVFFTPYVNNRMSSSGTLEKDITYQVPVNPTTSAISLSDADTQLENILFSTPDCEQGWKVYGLFNWTGGSITQFSMELTDQTPQNPLNSQ